MKLPPALEAYNKRCIALIRQQPPVTYQTWIYHLNNHFYGDVMGIYSRIDVARRFRSAFLAAWDDIVEDQGFRMKGIVSRPVAESVENDPRVILGVSLNSLRYDGVWLKIVESPNIHWEFTMRDCP